MQKAFDPESFRSSGHKMIDLLADLLIEMQKGDSKVTNHHDPNELLKIWDSPFPSSSESFFKSIVPHFIKIHNPNYVGHQVSAPAPLGALSALFDTFMNNGMGIYEMGEASTVMEKKVVEFFCTHLGYEKGDGLLTSGGTLANLTAMLAARSAIKERDVWTEGTNERYCILVSEMAHYCVDRAVRIMGWGSDGVVKVPVDDHYAMDLEALELEYNKAIEKGLKVVAVVGSAPGTATGTYDDLDAIADFCEECKIWYHIDGAHGGPAIFSEKYKYLMKGAERADSVVIDAHKMMLTPALATALLFKDSDRSYQTFSQKADYLWEQQKNDDEWYNVARRSFECTKFGMSIRVMSIISSYGVEIFDEFLTRQYDLARDFALVIEKSDDFTLATMPDANIVCFRYQPYDAMTAPELSTLNRTIRKTMLDDGTYYLVQTELKDGLYLRVSLMNPLTEMRHLEGMLDEVRKVGENVNESIEM